MSTPVGFKYPTAEEFASVLSRLLAKPVTGKSSYDLVLKGATGVFRTKEGQAAAWISFESKMASAASAALALMPASAARKGVLANGKLKPLLHEHYYEVINILGQVFNNSGKMHVVLDDIAYGTVPNELQTNDIVVYEIDIEGYGKGLVSLVALAA
ncbi:MAG: hypothetical protein ACJATT_005480 [Myxococcota bacterium]